MLFHEEGLTQKTDEREGGGGGESAGSDEPQPKRKTHSFSLGG